MRIRTRNLHDSFSSDHEKQKVVYPKLETSLHGLQTTVIDGLRFHASDFGLFMPSRVRLSGPRCKGIKAYIGYVGEKM
jgi:hypothetical protein